MNTGERKVKFGSPFSGSDAQRERMRHVVNANRKRRLARQAAQQEEPPPDEEE